MVFQTNDDPPDTRHVAEEFVHMVRAPPAITAHTSEGHAKMNGAICWTVIYFQDGFGSGHPQQWLTARTSQETLESVGERNEPQFELGI